MRRTTLSLALALAAVMPLIGTALAQDETSGSDDPWLLRAPVAQASAQVPLVGDEAVVRLDGTTGAVTRIIPAPVVDGCEWQTMVGPADGAIWLVRTTPSYLALSPDHPVLGGGPVPAMCVARLPLDGSEPEVYRTKDVFSFDDIYTFDPKSKVAAHADELYLAGKLFTYPDREGAEPRAEAGLFRFDAASGALDLVVPRATGVGTAAGKLFMMVADDSPYSSCHEIRVLDPGTARARALGGVKKKRGCASLAVGERVVAVHQSYPSASVMLFDPATEKRVRRFKADQLPLPLVADEALWTRTVKAGRWVPAFVTNGKKPKLEADDCVACTDPLVSIVSGAVWTMDGATLQRIDPATREVTLELDLRQVSRAEAPRSGGVQ